MPWALTDVPLGPPHPPLLIDLLIFLCLLLAHPRALQVQNGSEGVAFVRTKVGRTVGPPVGEGPCHYYHVLYSDS